MTSDLNDKADHSGAMTMKATDEEAEAARNEGGKMTLETIHRKCLSCDKNMTCKMFMSQITSTICGCGCTVRKEGEK